ncbi:acetyltransferase [Alloiococcus sp. CFN-8]|uniref:acetyltransferase n=1 Tax=Alloiococcus sp. CFN-8 TaxID=3416081 RepID=UPI003CF40BDA
MKNIVIIGAGGFGREVAWLIEDINKVKNEWNIVGFVDDNESVLGKEINGHIVVGNIDWLKEQDLYVINAIADPINKKEVIERLSGSKNQYPTLIHPSVICSNRIRFGEGSLICAGNILTVDIEIGNHVIINLDCTIGHDVIIEDYSTILPSVNVSGFVRLSKCTSIGTGSAIIQGVTIGEGTVIGAGSVVTKSLPSYCTAVGSPAKPIKFRK